MFCGKCGAKVDDGVKFCPKCGAPLQSGQPETPKSGVAGATPLQKKAARVLALIFAVNLVLALLWRVGTHVPSWNEPMSLLSLVWGSMGIDPTKMYFAACAVGLLDPVFSGLLLARHIRQRDEKVNGSLLSWLYWIWNAGVFVWITFIFNRTRGALRLTLVGWLYIACCAALLGLLLSLTSLRSKASKEAGPV